MEDTNRPPTLEECAQELARTWCGEYTCYNCPFVLVCEMQKGG